MSLVVNMQQRRTSASGRQNQDPNTSGGVWMISLESVAFARGIVPLRSFWRSLHCSYTSSWVFLLCSDFWEGENSQAATSQVGAVN